MQPAVAILLVNGPHNPPWGRWLDLCLRRLQTFTDAADYRLYVWNNDPAADWAASAVAAIPGARLLPEDPREALAMPVGSASHAAALQRLYEAACRNGATHVLTLDSDALPVRRGWLTYLVHALNGNTVLAGVWRDELRAAIAPYVHASCLCVPVAFVERHGLRFDRIDAGDNRIHDTLSSFTEYALAHGFGVHGLRRSNRRNIHFIMGGLYGDLVYHHGAGSRPDISFWGQPDAADIRRRNRAVWETATALLFENATAYLDCLRGAGAAEEPDDGARQAIARRLDRGLDPGLLEAPTAPEGAARATEGSPRQPAAWRQALRRPRGRLGVAAHRLTIRLRRRHAYLFVLASHNSGSTVLWRLLQTSPAVSALPSEGKDVPAVQPWLREDRWNPDKAVPWPEVKRAWHAVWDMRRPVLLEKSPPLLLFGPQLEAAFPDAHFLVMVRDPLAFCEGAKRRWLPDSRYADLAARWVQHGRFQMRNCRALQRVLWFTYEELTTQPERLRDRILDFMPALGGLDVQRAFAVHSLHGPVARPLTNLNTEQIGRLDTGAVRAINDVLAAAPDVMGFFHYPYRCV